MIAVDASVTEQEPHSALIFALAAERLAVFYEHHTWLTIAQGATLAADWLARSKSRLSLQQRKHLSELSDQVARQVADSVSREAGLHISYEMTEALDQRYVSEIGNSLLEECRRLLEVSPLPDQ
jgi:predicted Zn-dependent protease